MSRFTEDLVLGDPADWEPVTAIGLLQHLGVLDAPADAQRTAVAAWLVENEPSRICLSGLRVLGLVPDRHSDAA